MTRRRRRPSRRMPPASGPILSPITGRDISHQGPPQDKAVQIRCAQCGRPVGWVGYERREGGQPTRLYVSSILYPHLAEGTRTAGGTLGQVSELLKDPAVLRPDPEALEVHVGLQAQESTLTWACKSHGEARITWAELRAAILTHRTEMRMQTCTIHPRP